MAAFTASQASVTNGSKVFTINSGESTANIRQGDFLVLGTFAPVEILRGYVSSGGEQSIELLKTWDSGNQSNQKAIVIPTTVEVRNAVTALQNANTLVNDNFAAMQDWQTKTGTVTFTNQDGTTSTIKTLKQMENEANTQLAEYHPYPWAMRKVEFEARRAANNEKFVASGFVHLGKNITGVSYISVNEGLTTRQDSTAWANLLAVGVNEASTFDGVSKTDSPFINIAGVLTVINLNTFGNSNGVSAIKLPPAEDGTRTYDSATGVPVTHATPAIAFASETETNEVVTDRVDMWGFEAFLREINDADPFVYNKGLPQSLAANINGVTTVTDNVRPITYFAWYEGDTTSRGKGVNWQTASEAQRIVIASDPENNIYFDDSTGKFYQWCIRGRSFAGAGNGNWGVIDTTSDENLAFFGSKYVAPIGIKDTDIAYYNSTTNPDAVFYPKGKLDVTFDIGVGLYQAGRALGKIDSIAVNGDCYILVCGTVNRLNKGAYHPSFNPCGSGSYIGTGNNGNRKWYEIDLNVNSTAGCFDFRALTESNIGYPTTFQGAPWGRIGGYSGRPDGRFYDAIYASGAGGVCRDMRYSAWGLKTEDFAAADLAIKSGEYRGLERPSFTKVFGDTSARLENGHLMVRLDLILGRNPIDSDIITLSAFLNGNWYTSYHNKRSSLDWRYTTSLMPVGVGTISPTNTICVISLNGNLSYLPSIAGEFTYTEVTADPVSILLCDDLKDGWVGSWLPDLPDGVKDEFELTRPYSGAGTDITRTHTTDSGATWTQATTAIGNAAKNTVTVTNMPANQVTIWQYKTKAKMTKNAVNSAIRNINNVLISDSATQARDLGFALTSNVNTSTSNKAVELSLNQIGIDLATGKLSASKETKHVTIPLAAPTNNSPAFKALNYNVVENQQGFINYAYTELKHDGTDWGDDSKIHIVDNQSTMLDENGKTVLVGTARCVEPLGWIKNDK